MGNCLFELKAVSAIGVGLSNGHVETQIECY